MGKKKFNRKESAWRGFIGPTILLYSLWNVTLNEWDIHINGLCFFSLVFNFMPSQKKTVALDAQLRACPCSLKKKQNKKTLLIKSDLISSKYVYSQLTIKDCSSSRFRESTSITRHNGFSAHHDSLTTKMLDHGVTKKSSPHPPFPFPVQIQRIGKYIYTFFLYLYVRLSTQVCTRTVVR